MCVCVLVPEERLLVAVGNRFSRSRWTIVFQSSRIDRFLRLASDLRGVLGLLSLSWLYNSLQVVAGVGEHFMDLSEMDSRSAARKKAN